MEHEELKPFYLFLRNEKTANEYALNSFCYQSCKVRNVDIQ